MVRKLASPKRADNDLYETPHWCVDVLAERLERSLPTPDWVVDLGAGDGRIGVRVRDAFQAFGGSPLYQPKLYLIEIAPPDRLPGSIEPLRDHCYEGDVLDWFDSGKAHNVIDTSDNHPARVLYVSNPPFSLSHDFVWRAVAYVKGVHAPGSACAFLLREGWWISGGYTNPGRAEWVNANPPDAKIGLCPRPAFRHGQADNSEYSWHVWLHGAYHGTQMEVALRDDKGLERAKKQGGEEGGQRCLI